MNTKILFFSAPWCGPCKQMKKRLTENIKNELSIEIIDISENVTKSCEYQVMNVPTFIKIVDGKEVSRKVGSMTIDSLRGMLND